jgi:hypothetical protein
MMKPRRPGEPGYLGLAAEDTRAREIMRARAASPPAPRRVDRPQEPPDGLPLFGPPGLL